MEKSTKKEIVRKTGYHCWVYGTKTWHRTLDGATRIAKMESRWASDVQVIEVSTGDRVW